MNHRLPFASRPADTPSGQQTRPAHEIVDGGQALPCVDTVAEEVPVALVYNGVSHAVMLATPLQLDDFALGFSLTEGILADPADLRDLRIVDADGGLGIELRMEIPAARAAALGRQRRTLAGRTGCGLCGVENLCALAEHAQATRAPESRWQPLVPRAIERALRELPAHQPLFGQTGGVHAAAFADPDGHVVIAREDVGRHNALDKLLGAAASAGVDLGRGFVVCTSRASYEMAQKAARRAVALLVAVSSPTSRAIDIAERSGVTLCGFARDARVVAYSHPWRVTPPETSFTE